MGLLMLEAAQGETIRVVCEGEDAAALMTAVITSYSIHYTKLYDLAAISYTCTNLVFPLSKCRSPFA